MLDPVDGGSDLHEAVKEIECMKEAALKWASAMSSAGWTNNIGLFFNVFGHNNVNSLHLHIVDLNVTGPTYHFLEYKNCPLDVVLKVLNEELAAAAPRAEEAMQKAV